MEIKVTEKDLVGFEQDLWKDSRKLELGTSNGREFIRRYSDKQTSVKDEFQFITKMVDHISFKVPVIVDHSDTSISFDYIAGTRVFNFLMDLRSLYRQEDNEIYHSIGVNLVELLAKDLKEFQAYFQKRTQSLEKAQIYPAGKKLGNLYRILTAVLAIDFNLSELHPITEIYEQNAVIPFRDATTKNVILDLPHLFNKHFKSKQERQSTIRNLVVSGELQEKLKQTDIYHIDFSGCCYLCPIYDDWVALKEHEATSWLDPNTLPDPDQLSDSDLCTRFVRYSRLGGRKLAYRLLNNQGYQIRFGLDSEAFYFEGLEQISRNLLERGVVRTDKLEKLMDQLKRAVKLRPQKDYFHSWKKHHLNQAYYRDVFPG